MNQMNLHDKAWQVARKKENQLQRGWWFSFTSWTSFLDVTLRQLPLWLFSVQRPALEARVQSLRLTGNSVLAREFIALGLHFKFCWLSEPRPMVLARWHWGGDYYTFDRS